MTRYAATRSTRRLLGLEDEPLEAGTDNAWDRADPRIGGYVSRERNGVRTTRPHLVESIVADEPVTRCGRRLRKREGTSFRYEAVPARRVCARCSGG